MPIPLFVEICAGTAAVSLRLHRRGARPPVSRMGSKAGYADTILGALGLSPGQGAERYLWAEADPGVRLLLAAYTDRRLAQGAAEVIRGWAGEEPRALWERLRAEGPCKGAPGADAREVARWCYVSTRTMPQALARGATDGDFLPRVTPSGTVRYQPDSPASALSNIAEMPGRVVDSAGVDPYEVAQWLRIVSANRLINVGVDWRNTGEGGSTFGGAEFCTAIEDLLRAVEGVEEMPGAVVEGAAIDPREIARFILMGVWSYRQSEPDSGFIGPGQRRQDTTATATAVERVAFGLRGLVVDRADFSPPKLPAGTVVMIDPPYVNTTKYACDLSRSEVVRIARAWREAGARVAVCEAEPIGELVEEGWAFIDYADQRKGQKRTFSRQQREVLTMSEPAAPGWRRAEQVGLFGGGR